MKSLTIQCQLVSFILSFFKKNPLFLHFLIDEQNTTDEPVFSNMNVLNNITNIMDTSLTGILQYHTKRFLIEMWIFKILTIKIFEKEKDVVVQAQQM